MVRNWKRSIDLSSVENWNTVKRSFPRAEESGKHPLSLSLSLCHPLPYHITFMIFIYFLSSSMMLVSVNHHQKLLVLFISLHADVVSWSSVSVFQP